MVLSQTGGALGVLCAALRRALDRRLGAREVLGGSRGRAESRGGAALVSTIYAAVLARRLSRSILVAARHVHPLYTCILCNGYVPPVSTLSAIY